MDRSRFLRSVSTFQSSSCIYIYIYIYGNVTPTSEIVYLTTHILWHGFDAEDGVMFGFHLICRGVEGFPSLISRFAVLEIFTSFSYSEKRRK